MNSSFSYSTLISAEKIASGIEQLAGQIAKEYQNKPLILVSVQLGANFFLTDLMRALYKAGKVDVTCEVVRIKTYYGDKAGKKPEIISDVQLDILGKQLLIVEDIFDRGNTLDFVFNHFKNKVGDKGTVKSAVLLVKNVKRQTQYFPDYHVFTIENEFVVGYGLDYNEMYRNLPFVAILKLT